MVTPDELLREKRYYEVIDATGTPIMEVHGTHDEAVEAAREIESQQRRKMYVRGK